MAISDEEKEKIQRKAEEYMKHYRDLVAKLHEMSRMNVRQLMGTKAEGDPRVEYLTGLEAFRNVANVQIQVNSRLITDKLGVEREDFLALSQEIMEQQIKSMEEALAITGWKENGKPTLDLKRYGEKTRGWPE